MESAKIQIQIPTIVMNKELMNLTEDSEERKAIARKMREACDTYGCFLIDCPIISDEEQRRFFSSSEEFFALPDDTKRQYGRKPKLWHGGYFEANPYTRQESFGLYGLADDEIHSLVSLMWPQGNPSFCEVIKSMKMKFMDILLSVMKLTFEDLGISNYYEKYSNNVTGLMRGVKYKHHPKNNNNNKEDEKKTGDGLKPHVDHTIMSILYDNGVPGLEFLPDGGDWIPVTIPKGSLFVIVGDAFEVWSNGKFRPVKHRVTMNDGDVEKYTCAFFLFPKDGVAMEVPPELVKEGDCPMFPSFVFSDFLEKHVYDTDYEALKDFAGVNVVV